MIVSALMGLVPTSAVAATAYQIAGEWAAGTPTTVTDGNAVTAEWRVSVNDDGVAPRNAPVDNVTFTVTAVNGVFDGLPEPCLTSGVSSPSALSADRRTLTCNLGTKNEGTAIVVSTPIDVTGSSGESLSASGTIEGQTASVEQIPIDNDFDMDIAWGTSVGTVTNNGGTSRDARMQWTLFQNRAAGAGPTSVTYTLTVTDSVGDGLAVGPGACQPFTTGIAAGHPWSAGTHPATQSAPFPGSCTLVRTSGAGAGTATFQLTISGIDYSQTQVPTKDSTGQTLPNAKAAIATGEVVIRADTAAPQGSFTLTSDAPSYTPAAGGSPVDDDPSNNTASAIWNTSYFQGGWDRQSAGQAGSVPTDNLRVAPGTIVGQFQELTYPSTDGTWEQGAQCVTLDTQYVQFVDTHMYVGSVSHSRVPTSVPEATFRYYVTTDPITDPNGFHCNDASQAANWTTALPSDLSTVRAVMVSYPWTTTMKTAGRTGLYVDVQIKAAVAIGQDVWAFGGYMNTTSTNPASQPGPGFATGIYPNRGFGAPANGQVATPGARYPFSARDRDILRVVGATPTIDKTVTPTVALPGEAVSYTLTYSARADQATRPTVDDYQIMDTLPVGMAYTNGSATPAPVISTATSGQQTLTWTLDGVTTDLDHTLTYQATLPTTAAPGDQLTNTATSTVDGQTSPETDATVRISRDGFTGLAKASDLGYIPNLNGDGEGATSWTVTLASQDPITQPYTDVVDVLPYNGDGRGTSFAGSYALSGPVTHPAGTTVYYTTAAPGSVSMDPADPSNGASGSVAGNTVGWSTTFTPAATAIRAIHNGLTAGTDTTFTIPYSTTGMDARDVLVNVAQGRAQHTRLLMRTSAQVTVATKYSASLKKYVADPDDPGQWLDANGPASYARYQAGDSVPYKVVVTNTGQTELQDISVTDDLRHDLGDFHIDRLEPGSSRTHVYSVTLAADTPSQVVNTACATAPQPADASGPVDINCDTAGINVLNLPLVQVAKSATPTAGSPVVPGQAVTYHVTFDNTGTTSAQVDYTDDLAGVLDDAAFVPGSVVATDGVAGAFTAGDQSLRIMGTIAAGHTATIAYQVTVKGADSGADSGDGELDNYVVTTGDPPPATCAADNPLCTVHPVSDISAVKTVSPADGSRVKAGQVLTYTLVFSSSGQGAGAVAYVDDLSRVLDDATFVDGSLRSTSLEVTDRVNAKLHIRGVLRGNQTASVSYQVTVMPDGKRGDSDLVNYLVKSGDHLPPSCARGDQLCTEHTVSPAQPGYSGHAGHSGEPGPHGDTSWLPNTGGPRFYLLLLGVLMVLGGATLIGGRRHRH